MQRARTDSDKLRRRNVMLEAALDEFFECGFSGARMDDIARRAGLSKGTVYLYFDSKESLFQALIESLASPNLGAIEEIMNSARSFQEAMDRLQKFAPSLMRTSRLPMLMKVMIGDSHAFPAMVQRYRKDIIDRVLAALAAMLDRASRSGEISVGDPALTARLVIAPMVMSGIWQAVFAKDPDAEVDLEALFTAHGEYLKRALVVEAGS